jgi:hypothetical protein
MCRLRIPLLTACLLGLLALAGNTPPTCTPVAPEAPVCLTAADCEGLPAPAIACLGKWSCENAACSWRCDFTGCTQDSDCLVLPRQSCCPPPPNPCTLEPQVGQQADYDAVKKWLAESCVGEPICPQYSPPLCPECLDVLTWAPACEAGACVTRSKVDCTALCTALAKAAEEPCPFVNAQDALTAENALACGCCGINQATLCDMMPPVCPEGYVASSDGACWKDCVNPLTCEHVPFPKRG